MWGELPTRLLLDAERRRLEAEGRVVMIRHRGDDERGGVLVLLNHGDGTCTLWRQQRQSDGQLGWQSAEAVQQMAEPEAEALIAREIGWDRDLWVVEIEQRDGRLPLVT